MNNYETLFILNNELDEESRNALIEKFKGVISKDGEVLDVSEWGTRRLAYEIDKKNEGYYVLIDFKANPELPKELQRNFKISDNVMRYIVVSKEGK